MGLRPVNDPAGARDRAALVEYQDRHVDLAGELRHLLAPASALAPGPGREPVTGEIANLVLVAGLVQRLRGPAARMSHRAERLLLAAGVEDHGARLSRRAITSGTCSR